MPNLVGQTIANRYRVDDFLGRGGMAEVYKVWDNRRMTFLAMKLLRDDLAMDKIFLRRFRREADNLARLQHPHIVRFYGLERHDLLAFMLMDYVEGVTLKQKIFTSDARGLPLAEVRKVTRAVCSALQFAHSEGLIHCDLKPGNVMINQHGTVLLADFGIARMTDAATATMVGMGTPAYMAPEQVKGLDPVPQTDIYAVGVTLFEMLTGGERPFIGERATVTGTTSAKVRWEQVNLEPPSPRQYNPALSIELEAVVLKCLAKRSEDRYQTPLDLLNALERAVGEEQTAVLPALEPEPKPPAPQPEKEQPERPASEAPTQLESEPENVQRSNAPTQTWWQRYGGWIGLVGIVALVLGLIIGTRKAPEPETIIETVVVEDDATKVAAQPAPTDTLAPTATNLPTDTSQPTPTHTSALTDTPQPTATYTLAPTNTPLLTATPSPTVTNTSQPTQPLVLGIGSTQVSEVDSMVQVYVPEGEFKMGSERGHADERPVHSVYLDAYWIDQHEITNGMFAEFLNEQGNQEEEDATWLQDGSADVLIEQRDGQWQPKSGYAAHPVINVSWYGAHAYCQWAGRRLPTEAEWEKAARGEIRILYPWGDYFDCSRGNFDDETIIDDYVIPGGEDCDGYDRTAPVGSFTTGASPYGALDMAGNVWEWVADWYDDDYYEKSPSVNPTGPDESIDHPHDDDDRVLRGGSWDVKDFYLRVTFRNINDPSAASKYVGFRCASEAKP